MAGSAVTTYLHYLRGYRSSRFPIAPHRKSHIFESDGGRIQHLYIASSDPCSNIYICIYKYYIIYYIKYIYILYYILYILYIYYIIYIYTRKPCVSPSLKSSYVTFEICISFRRNTFVAIVTPKKCILTCGHQ